MNASELRNKSLKDLEVELQDQLSEQFKRKMQSATGQLAQSHLLKESRRKIARIKTLIREKAGN